MTDTQKAMIRYLFQNVISTQRPAIYEFLMAEFFGASGYDSEDAREMMEAWQKLEGFIASHGLED